MNHKRALSLSARTSHAITRHLSEFDRRGGRLSRIAMPSVPRRAQISPGKAVSIVLKKDQPTGKQSQGSVKDVLTAGDHPRGVKVRLTDGRIGRVQKMLDALAPTPTGNSAPAGEPSDFIAASDPAASSGFQVRSEGTRGGQGLQPRYRDVRLDEPLEQPAEEMDLMAYVKPAKQKKGKKASQTCQESEDSGAPHPNGPAATISGALAKCPVCNDFEGDEAAVAHHVELHFR